MSEDRKCCCTPLGLIETELAIIIVLLSLLVICECLCDDDKPPKKPKKDC